MKRPTVKMGARMAPLIQVLLATGVLWANANVGLRSEIPELEAAASIVRDTYGIAHIWAQNEHDLFFLQGWAHARDRLFQMDGLRRMASGTLAELVGPDALAGDVQLRTIGLRRAAERSLEVLLPRTLAALEAYAEGVNAFVGTHALPPEYDALEVTQFAPWTATDSLVVGKLAGFRLSFQLDTDTTLQFNAYLEAGGAMGFDGARLFFEDVVRSAPFDPASTVPDASNAALSAPLNFQRQKRVGIATPLAASEIRPGVIRLCERYLEELKDIPFFEKIRHRERHAGSNLWAVSGAHTTSGLPLIASDPHLELSTPMIWYPIGLHAGSIQVFGSGFAGVPGIVHGHNEYIAWGTTNAGWDVTDTFQEHAVLDLSSPSGLSTVYKGEREHIIFIPEVFRQNNPGNGAFDDITEAPAGGAIPPVTAIVPRRNNGPIVQYDLVTGEALSIQYTGFSPTREFDCFLLMIEAKNLDDFISALQYFDNPPQNWVYADVEGNIAFFTSGELPVREDLQAGAVVGLPPWFVRDGSGGNEWLLVQNPQPEQAVPYEILPFSELPQIINPPEGWFVNANNDSAGLTLDNDPLNDIRPGGGIQYLRYAYARGFRAGRITQMIRQRLATGSGKISFRDMQEMQSDVVMLDAQVFAPYILQAFANARMEDAHPTLAALADDTEVAGAVERLGNWEGNTPTGIPEGYDASDEDGILFMPSDEEVQASIAATIYSVWRGQFIRNTSDATLTLASLPSPDSYASLTALRHLLDNFDANEGVGASGLNFFNVPGVEGAGDRRDIIILKSLQDALALLSGEPFEAAFNRSTNQDDYRWGKVHRVVFAHELDGQFSIPPAGGAFPAPLEGLPGIPTDGGFATVDVAPHPARADDVNDFMFEHGPSRRFVAEFSPGHIRAESSWPGGTSGVLGNPFYFNLLPLWLTNDAVPLKAAASCFRVQRMLPQPDGSILLQWESEEGIVYVVETADSLMGPWTPISDEIPSGGDPIEWADSPPQDIKCRFYRIGQVFP